MLITDMGESKIFNGVEVWVKGKYLGTAYDISKENDERMLIIDKHLSKQERSSLKPSDIEYKMF